LPCDSHIIPDSVLCDGGTKSSTTTFNSSSGEGEVHPEDEQQVQSVTPYTYKLPDSWNGQHGGFVVVQQHAWESDEGAPKVKS
jgi:hypothetical protein